MADKKSTEKNIRKLTKLGKKSIGLTLPIEMVRDLGWKEKQRVVVKKSGNKLIISDWKK
jgi:antitoxin component of MazEF toxin-antitoxin module